MMIKKLVHSALLSTLIITGGCALSPQQVEVAPHITLPVKVPVVKNTVNVSVVDDRLSKVLGTRGGIYDKTSTLTIKNDITLAVKHAVEQALLKMEMQLDPNNPAVRFTVYIDKIDYSTPAQNYVTEVNINAVARAEVKFGDRVYHGRYQSTAKHKVVKAPSETKNEEIVNGIINNVLDRMFSDQALVKFLRSG
ncbi:YajG family lipoprotein [Spartinivicinus poritis]|uniref:YajG family lipoprotein n=1 Tax=Spartinivicinus poritis TaxID=2994640 RepID=A0ABT5U9J7_9GAMM|nr:YajG family lipoprotein [Spartinivicinus sp. A2-2]MDE1463041.1 YajG family lipoprotein [Spartinivicinus sp. A2-2]